MDRDRVRGQKPKVPSVDPGPKLVATELELGVQIIVRAELIKHLSPETLKWFKCNVLAYAEAAARAWRDESLSCYYCKNSPASKRGDDVICANCEHLLGSPE